jgi:hypothetical protein
VDKAIDTLGTWGLVVTLALTSSVIAAVLGKFMDRSASHLDRVRDGYAEAARALAAWDQFPYATPSGWAYVQAFSAGFRYRFGWRRYLIPSMLLKSCWCAEDSGR